MVFFLLDPNEGITHHFQFATPIIMHIYQDQAGIFWLATSGGGLIRWDQQTGTINQYTTKDGLSHNVIYAVYEDRDGFLWMPSKMGLMRFEKKHG